MNLEEKRQYAGVELKQGETVKIFYRADKQPSKFRFIATQSRAEGIFRPRHGLSDGWVVAEVLRDYDPKKYKEENKILPPKKEQN